MTEADEANGSLHYNGEVRLLMMDAKGEVTERAEPGSRPEGVRLQVGERSEVGRWVLDLQEDIDVSLVTEAICLGRGETGSQDLEEPSSTGSENLTARERQKLIVALADEIFSVRGSLLQEPRRSTRSGSDTGGATYEKVSKMTESSKPVTESQEERTARRQRRRERLVEIRQANKRDLRKARDLLERIRPT